MKKRLTAFLCLLVVCVFTSVFWSTLSADMLLFRGDASYYFSLIDNSEWTAVYPHEPMLFILARGGDSFWVYLLTSIFICNFLVAWAALSSRYRLIDSILIILFFSFSFYGAHLSVNFQRQFLALGFFLCAISYLKVPLASLLLAVFSFLSHQFAFILFASYALARLPRRAVLAAATAVSLMLLGLTLSDASISIYASAVGDDFSKYVAKQIIAIAFAMYIYNQAKRSCDPFVANYALLYTIVAAPVIVSPGYAGLFSRVDYFLFPFMVYLWPRVSTRRGFDRVLFLAFIACSGYLWLQLNFSWIINAEE